MRPAEEPMSPTKHHRSVRRTQLVSRAREMRSAPTPAEAILWKRLRRKQLLGLRFRRQQPHGGYILDFYCKRVSLAIELDGDSHAERQSRDRAKDEALAREGIGVIRFHDRQVKENLEGVLQVIYDHCRSALAEKPE